MAVKVTKVLRNERITHRIPKVIFSSERLSIEAHFYAILEKQHRYLESQS